MWLEQRKAKPNSTQFSHIHHWGGTAQYAPFRLQIGTQDQYPLCPPCLPTTWNIYAWPQRALADRGCDISLSFWGQAFPSRPLGENHKNKTGASYVPRGMFSPWSHFIELFGAGHRPWGICEASQRYPCNRPNYRPALTSSAVALASLATDVFKLPHLVRACFYKETLLTFLSKLPPPKSLPQSLFIESESYFVCYVGVVLAIFQAQTPKCKLLMGRNIFCISL